MANRNVPKIEWATRLTTAAPEPAPVAEPLTDETLLETVLNPLDAAPLSKAGMTTVGDFRNAGDLTSIKGIGQARAKKIFDAINGNQTPEPAADAQNTLQPMLDAFTAIDTALEISKATLVLSSGYPRLVTVEDQTYIVIRWGMCARYQYFLTALANADLRFHACPPLSVHDTGMIECRGG